MYVFINRFIYVHISIDASMYICTYVYVYIHMNVFIYECICMCVYVHLSICMNMCIHWVLSGKILFICWISYVSDITGYIPDSLSKQNAGLSSAKVPHKLDGWHGVSTCKVWGVTMRMAWESRKLYKPGNILTKDERRASKFYDALGTVLAPDSLGLRDREKPVVYQDRESREVRRN